MTQTKNARNKIEQRLTVISAVFSKKKPGHKVVTFLVLPTVETADSS